MLAVLFARSNERVERAEQVGKERDENERKDG
jgi:hypothetical protein